MISTKKMRKLDSRAVERLGIPSVVLMENAGLHAAEKALSMLKVMKSSKVVVFCGLGKNGGDGLVCSRHLINKKVRPRVYLVGKKSAQMADETKTNLEILINMKVPITRIFNKRQLSAVKKKLKDSLIIDALLGIGLKSKVREPFSSMIEIINETGAAVLALDVPSGLDADTGLPQGVAIKAKETVTFCAPKIGLCKLKARRFIGKLTVADIGISHELLNRS